MSDVMYAKCKMNLLYSSRYGGKMCLKRLGHARFTVLTNRGSNNNIETKDPDRDDCTSTLASGYQSIPIPITILRTMQNDHFPFSYLSYRMRMYIALDAGFSHLYGNGKARYNKTE